MKPRAKASVLTHLYYDNIFCSLNSFFPSHPPSCSRGHGPVSRRWCSCVPHAPPPTSGRALTPRLPHDDGALLTDHVRDEQTTRPQCRRVNTGDLPHRATGVMQRRRYVTTRGCLTSEGLHVLRILAVVQDLACTKAAVRCPRGRHVSGGDSHRRIGPQGGREKWAITTARKGIYERP